MLISQTCWGEKSRVSCAKQMLDVQLLDTMIYTTHTHSHTLSLSLSLSLTHQIQSPSLGFEHLLSVIRCLLGPSEESCGHNFPDLLFTNLTASQLQ